MPDAGAFRYLNVSLDWPAFALTDLERAPDGRLTLARVPRAVQAIGAEQPAPDPAAGPHPTPAPAGIAVTPDCACNVYVADPVRHRIWRYDACAGEPEPLPYLHGPGALPGRVTAPRGLAIAAASTGPRLYVADSGNHRIQVIDLITQQPLGVWGQPDPYAAPAPGDGPGHVNDPWDLAVDRAGDVYVVDHGNSRLQKFTPRGEVDDRFRQAVAMQAITPMEPVRVAIAGQAGAERVYVLDRAGAGTRVLVYDTGGVLQAPGQWPVQDIAEPVALAATAEAVYAGSADGRIAKYSPEGALMSTTGRLLSGLAVLASGCPGELLAGPGGLPVTRLAVDGGYVAVGSFRAGPFEYRARPVAWHRWRVLADALAENAHVQLFTFASAQHDDPRPLAGTRDAPFADAGWSAQARDELDVLVLSAEVRDTLRPPPPADDPERAVEKGYFWLGGILRGDGAVSPVLRQMRLDFAPTTAIAYLPTVYRDGPRRRLFVDLLLALLGGEIGGVEDALEALARFFDPAAAPADALPWLAGWLDFDLVETWSEEETRRNIAGAMGLYARRGTVEGLRRYLELYAGVSARIEEPAADVSLFTLDEQAALGFTTVLAPAHEQGAVLGRTATAGQSHLLDAADGGVPVFADLANRFCVQVYGSQLVEPRTRELLAQVLERERPAHTTYHLCVIEPRMRVGVQARLGIDSIVAGPAPDLRLGDPAALGTETVLADRPRRSRRLGGGLRVGSVI